jgi:hypothetical protein
MGIFIEDIQQSAKLRTLAPLSQSTFDANDLVTMAHEELQLKLVSDIMEVREDFFLTSQLTPLVAMIDHYVMPERAIGNALKTLFYIDPVGNPVELDRVDVDRITAYSAGGGGSPEKYYFEGDEVVILPKPTTSAGSLMFSYFAKPNRITLTSNCAKITGKSSASGTTAFAVNTDLTASIVVGDLVDFVSSRSPFLLWAFGVPVTAISSSEIQVATANVSNAAGVVEPLQSDFICPNGYSNIPMVPEAFHPVLSQMVAIRMLAALGDLDKWQAAKAELTEVRKEANKLIKNRVESSPRTLKNNSGLVPRVSGSRIR